MKIYKVKTKSDQGNVTWKGVATSPENAKETAMKALGCPECAVVSVTEAITLQGTINKAYAYGAYCVLTIAFFYITTQSR